MGKVTKYSQLAPRKRLFVDYYMKTNDIISSYFAAGYMAGCDQENKDKRLLAYRNGRTILSEPLVKAFVEMNKPVIIPPSGEIDIADITDRMLLILEGNIEQQVVIKGKIAYVKPSFRDQIEAGKLLNAILEKREKKAEKRASKALAGKVTSLIGSARPEVYIEDDSRVEQ